MYYRVIAVVAFGLAVSFNEQQALAGDGGLEVYFIDVEGGAATLLVTPQKESILVDSGYPDRDDRDAKRIHRVATEVAGLQHIDHYVTTHWHLDHYGSIAALSRRMPVRHFWDRGIPAQLAEDPKFPERIAVYREVSGGRSRTLRPGDRLPLLGSSDEDVPPVEMRIVVADRKVIGRRGASGTNPICKEHEPKPADPSDNAASLGFVLSFGRFDFLCLGDLTWNMEHELVCPTNLVGEVDLFMVTHHGLNISNNPVLVNSVRPRVAVACNGPHKGADPEVIRTLRGVGDLEAIYQLHLNLDSTPEENTDVEYIANVQENCEAQFIKATVAASGESYTITLGDSGAARVYRSR